MRLNRLGLPYQVHAEADVLEKLLTVEPDVNKKSNTFGAVHTHTHGESTAWGVNCLCVQGGGGHA